MTDELKDNNLVLFENSKIRRKEYNREWYYSIIDIIGILTTSDRPEKYWNDLKRKLENEEYFELSDKIGRLKLIAKDGKLRETDCGNR